MSAAFSVDQLNVRIGSAQILTDVTWSVEPGQTVGVVGESGSGKSITVLAATGLVPRPPAVVDGRAMLATGGKAPVNLLDLGKEELRRIRGNRIGFVFQDPSGSLNPLMRVEDQIVEALQAHTSTTRDEQRRRAVDLLEMVGIPDPGRRVKNYPHEMSGGMKQRVMIAIALSCDPEVLIADEPTTALDVTIQAQIIDVVKELQQRLGTAVVWISHDLGVVGGLADEVVVLYGGQVVERAGVETLFAHHSHPYTRGLLDARPKLGRSGAELVTIPGSPPDPKHLPPGCVFYDRCSLRLDDRCATERPPLLEIGENHLVRSFCATASQEHQATDSKGAARG